MEPVDNNEEVTDSYMKQIEDNASLLFASKFADFYFAAADTTTRRPTVYLYFKPYRNPNPLIEGIDSDSLPRAFGLVKKEDVSQMSTFALLESARKYLETFIMNNSLIRGKDGSILWDKVMSVVTLTDDSIAELPENEKGLENNTFIFCLKYLDPEVIDDVYFNEYVDI